MTDVRIERDCLGEMEIPNDQYYGIQTHRMEKVSGVFSSSGGIPLMVQEHFSEIRQL